MISILLCAFVALSLVQTAGAAELSAAPLNPDFINYFDENHGTAAERTCTDTNSENATTKQVFSGGIIPAPSTPYWPSGEQDRSNVRAANAVGICADAAPLPSYFNLRDEGRLTPVRDQGKCGSCWAFAAYGSLESTLLTDTGVSWDFSESNMNNLCSSPYQDSFDYGHCNGGDAPMSTAYLARWSGPIHEEDDPYLLPIPSTESSTFPPVVHVQNVSFLPPRKDSLDNDLLKQTVYEKGAIHVAFNLNLSCFGQDVTDYHNETNYYLPPEGYISDGGHAVTLAGWNDDYPAANFTVTPPGDGAFIIKNSWGTTSNDDGFLYISYYDSSFDTEGYASVLFTAEPVDRLNTIYQYDPLGWTSRIGYTNTTCYGANVFTADSDEDLRAVSFYTTEPGTEYVAAVFRDIDTPPGNDAGPVAWVSGSAELPGYHTIPLLEPVSLSPGQTFSVVLKVTAPTDIRPLVVERPIDNYSSKATALPGQSYVSEDGDEWDDLTTSFADTNVCIKAFTTDALRVPTNYPTIMDAVDAARAGDTVIVESGTYRENVVLNTAITLRGRDTGDGLPVIDACGSGTALSVTADNVTVEGFELTGGTGEFLDAGLSVEADYVTLIGCSALSNAGAGICIYDSQGSTLSNCSANGNERGGIRIYDSPGSTLNNCITDANAWDGIYMRTSPGSTLNTCSVNGNERNGIVIGECTSVFEAGTDWITLSGDSDTIRHITGTDATSMADNPLFISSPRIPSDYPRDDVAEMRIPGEENSDPRCVSGHAGVSRSGCRADISDKKGTIISDTPSVLLTHCRVTDNGNYGISIDYTENCVLTNNSMEENPYNFGLEGGSANEFVHSIDTSNTVDGKPIYYLLNATANPGGDFTDAGTIYAVNCRGLDIHDITLSDNGFGIFFWNTTSSTIRDVMTLENNNCGICLQDSLNNSITACNTLKNNYCGIRLQDSSNNSIDHCEATENNIGMALTGSSNNRITACEASENSNTGINLETSSNNSIANCKTTGNYCGISTVESSNNRITGCEATGNKHKGIYVYYSKQCTLTGNTMDANRYNFVLQGSEDANFVHSIDTSNTVDGKSIYYLQNATANPEGDFADAGTIYAVNCTGLDIHDLTFSDNFAGVFAWNSSDIDIHDLTLSGNNCGICLLSSTNITLDTITATENYHSILLSRDRNCIVSNCTTSHDTEGLTIRSSDNCTLCLNSFINTTVHEGGYSHDILWNTPSPVTYLYGGNPLKITSPMGNYWGAAYNGTDLNNDGIGDTPFTGDGFNDTYPLMAPLDAYTLVGDTDAYSDGGNGADSGHASATGNLNTGDAVEMQFSGTAVTGVTITAAGQITMMVVTIGPIQTGPEGLSGPVYQYLEANLIHTTNTAIGEATFTFDVPTAWLTAQGLTPADVVLWRFHDGVWVSLPTEIVSEGAHTIVYRAVSPGFSYFAVGTGAGAGAGAGAMPADTPAPAETPISKPVTESPADPAVPSVPSETEDKTAAAAATVTPPQGTPAGIVPLLTGLGAAALLFRRH